MYIYIYAYTFMYMLLLLYADVFLIFKLFCDSDAAISSLEPLPSKSFDAAKFTCANAEVLKLLCKLAGLTGEVSFL